MICCNTIVHWGRFVVCIAVFGWCCCVCNVCWLRLHRRTSAGLAALRTLMAIRSTAAAAMDQVRGLLPEKAQGRQLMLSQKNGCHRWPAPSATQHCTTPFLQTSMADNLTPTPPLICRCSTVRAAPAASGGVCGPVDTWAPQHAQGIVS